MAVCSGNNTRHRNKGKAFNNRVIFPLIILKNTNLYSKSHIPPWLHVMKFLPHYHTYFLSRLQLVAFWHWWLRWTDWSIIRKLRLWCYFIKVQLRSYEIIRLLNKNSKRSYRSIGNIMQNMRTNQSISVLRSSENWGLKKRERMSHVLSSQKISKLI